MNNERIINQIIKGLEEGHTRERVKVSLLASGWSAGDIEEGFNQVNTTSPVQNNPMKLGKYLKIIIGLLIVSALIYVGIQLVFQVNVMPIIVSPKDSGL